MKKRRGITAADRDRWIAEWEEVRETGYAPFIRTEDLSSEGIKTRVRGVKSEGRVHHLMSLNEFYAFLQFEFSDFVTNIYEQFPLLPLSRTQAIPLEANISHIRYDGTTVDAVVTVDLMVEVLGERLYAFSVKDDNALDDERTEEKQFLESAFCELEGIPWRLLEASQLKTVQGRNLELLHGFASPNEVTVLMIEAWLPAFFASASELPEGTLASAIQRSANHTGIDYHTAVELFYASVWRKSIYVDLWQHIRLEQTCRDLGVAPYAGN